MTKLEAILTTIFLIGVFSILMSFVPWGRTAADTQALAPGVEFLKKLEVL